MRFTERGYDDFVEDHFPNMVVVREWEDCVLWSAGVEEYWLVLFDRGNRRVSVFEYDSREEWAKDIALVLRLRDSDEEGGAPVPATVKPTPSSCPALNVQPLPPVAQES